MGEPTGSARADEDGTSAERAPRLRTGAEAPVDPEDLVLAEGQDPTPENVERARHRLAEKGPAAVEEVTP